MYSILFGRLPYQLQTTRRRLKAYQQQILTVSIVSNGAATNFLPMNKLKKRSLFFSANIVNVRTKRNDKKKHFIFIICHFDVL